MINYIQYNNNKHGLCRPQCFMWRIIDTQPDTQIITNQFCSFTNVTLITENNVGQVQVTVILMTFSNYKNLFWIFQPVPHE